MTNRTRKGKRAEFRVGQVVCVKGSYEDPDEYGIIDGFDDGRWHVNFGGKTRKILWWPPYENPRALTKREKGPSHART